MGSNGMDIRVATAIAREQKTFGGRGLGMPASREPQGMLDRRFSTTWRSSAEELRAVLTELVRRHRVPGAQLAVRSGGETIVVQTGVEREGRPWRMRASSKVPVGSITKALTATVVMMLVADDDLELDAPLSEVLPTAPGA